MIQKTLPETFLAILFATLVLLVAPSAQARQCSLAGSAGNFGFTLTGTILLPTGAVPIAAVGRATIDAAGNVSGTESRSVGGGFADETFTGTLTVNPDCTGTLTVKFYESGQLVRTSVVSTVAVDNQREVRGVQKSLVLPNGTSLPVVITLEAKKTFSIEEND
jgi:hypothetical protein